jgi:hypothetical protein
MSRPPLLLIDVDGVISLFGFDPTRPPDGKLLLVDGIPHYLSTSVAELIKSLSTHFEMAWCSGWEDKADQYLPQALDVPRGLPHLSFDQPPGSPTRDQSPGALARHWKLAAIDAYAGPDRPLAWIDDAFDDSCHSWARNRAAPTLLVTTEPAVGLTAGQAGELVSWARSLERAVAPGAGPEPLEP